MNIISKLHIDYLLKGKIIDQNIEKEIKPNFKEIIEDAQMMQCYFNTTWANEVLGKKGNANYSQCWKQKHPNRKKEAILLKIDERNKPWKSTEL